MGMNHYLMIPRASIDAAPELPGSFAAVVDPVVDNKIVLTWVDNSDDETGFEIQRSTDGGANWSALHVTASNVEIYNNSGLSLGKQYEYRIRAVGAVGNSGWTISNAITRVPAPVTLTATTISASQIDLEWTDSTSGQLPTRIERSPDGTSDWTEVDLVAAGVTTLSDTGLTESTAYYYRAIHVGEDAESLPSNVSDATTDPGVTFDPGPYTWNYGDAINTNSNTPGYWSYGIEFTGFPNEAGSYWFANCEDQSATDRTSFLVQIDAGAVVNIAVPSKSTSMTFEIAAEYQDPGSGGQGGWEMVVPVTGDFEAPDAENEDIVITIITPA